MLWSLDLQLNIALAFVLNEMFQRLSFYVVGNEFKINFTSIILSISTALKWKILALHAGNLIFL